MEFGVAYLPTHDGINPAALARMLEEAGQDALFFAEHTHIPASRESPYPYADGSNQAQLPRKYWHCYDLFVALTAAAVSTSKLRIGSGICLVVQRDPIITAKEVASLDHLSGGRFEFGIGAGWNREEMRNHGTDPRRRMKVLRERVEAMKVIWSQHEASYHGDFVDFDRTASGATPNLPSGRTLQSWSAVKAPRSWTGYSPSGTGGSQTTAETRKSSPASRNCSHARNALLKCNCPYPPTLLCSSARSDPERAEQFTGCPPGPAARSNEPWITGRRQSVGSWANNRRLRTGSRMLADTTSGHEMVVLLNELYNSTPLRPKLPRPSPSPDGTPVPARQPYPADTTRNAEPLHPAM